MEREREVEHEPQVLEGEDEVPRQPAPLLDAYTPEPGPRPGERRAFAALGAAVVVLVLVFALVLWALR